MLEVLYHHAKFGGARISPAAGVTKNVANWQQSDKVEHGCTTTNLPLSNGVKIVSVLQRFHGERWRTISDVQKRDEQTDRQTDRQTDKKLNVFGHPAGG